MNFGSLKALQKPHYCWPIAKEKLFTIGDNLSHYIRVTKNITIGDGYDVGELYPLLDLCKLHNAHISYLTSPWHRVWPADLDPKDLGPRHSSEVNQFRSRLEWIKARLLEYNQQKGTSIQCKAILFDSEIFNMEAADEITKAAIKLKYDSFYISAKNFFPEAPVHWYALGSIRDLPTVTGFGTNRHHLGIELHDSFTVPLYKPWETHLMIEVFKRTAANWATIHPNEPPIVYPFISLGAGYKRGIKTDAWVEDYDYETYYSWIMGGLINNPWYSNRPDRYGDFKPAKGAIFYPHPFINDTWSKHFIAYVKGAYIDQS